MHEIRPIPENELFAFVIIIGQAYPAWGFNNEEDVKNGMEHYSKALSDPRTKAFGYYRDDQLIGGIILYDYVMNLYGKKILVGGAGTLAVRLMNKKEHVAKELMTFCFNHYRDKKSPLAILWPFRPDFYRKMGAGPGTRTFEYNLDLSKLQQGDKSHIRDLTVDDMPALNDCYNRYVDQTHGMIEETSKGRELTFEQRKKFRYVGYVIDGQVKGYLIFTFDKGTADSFLDHHLVVNQMVYESPQVLAELIAFLQSQADQFERVTIYTPDPQLFHLFDDARNNTHRVFFPVNHESHKVGLGIMYRVLDSKLFLKQLSHRNFNGQNCKVHLNITDTFMSEIDQSVTLHFSDGVITVENDGKFDVEVTIKIADFSSLIMGAADFADLYNYGRLTVSDSSYVQLLNILFHADQRPVCFTDF